jgi:hypothetical protein
MSENVSKYDNTRDTVGAIYRDAQLHGERVPIEAGDMTNQLLKSMLVDLEAGIDEGTKQFEGKEFYLTVHEKKDMQMPNCILRRIIKTPYRPWPEDDTIVFHIIPSAGEVLFCWCLPHWSEMENMLNSASLFDDEMLMEIRAWKAYDLHCFGFEKTGMGHWIPSLNWKDKKLTNRSSVLKSSYTS